MPADGDRAAKIHARREALRRQVYFSGGNRRDGRFINISRCGATIHFDRSDGLPHRIFVHHKTVTVEPHIRHAFDRARSRGGQQHADIKNFAGKNIGRGRFDQKLPRRFVRLRQSGIYFQLRRRNRHGFSVDFHRVFGNRERPRLRRPRVVVECREHLDRAADHLHIMSADGQAKFQRRGRGHRLRPFDSDRRCIRRGIERHAINGFFSRPDDWWIKRRRRRDRHVNVRVRLRYHQLHQLLGILGARRVKSHRAKNEQQQNEMI